MAVGGRLAELAEAVKVGRQHSWYHGPKPDISTCLTNSRFRVRVRVRVMECRF